MHTRWLKGEEYGFLLRHYNVYTTILGQNLCSYRQQPDIIYSQPRSKNFKLNGVLDGLIYFIKGMHLREYGFPRKKEDTSKGLELKKKSFKWKKTNFVTDLPKHNPIVRYLVAKSRNPSLTD